MDILEIDNIELNYGTKRILDAVYMKFEKGKITGILGKNGCGKTSLLEIIFGSLSPKNKLIRADSKPILKSLYKKGYIKYLPQFNIAPKTISLKRLFDFYSVSILEFYDYFPTFKITENIIFNQLSGGERRVIEVFLTLKTSSKIVLLDEPFSHIAPLYIQKIKELIEKEKHLKIIIITDHFYEDVMDISETIYLLKNGWSKLINNKEDLKFNKYLN